MSDTIQVTHIIQAFAVGGLEQFVRRLAVAGRTHGVEASVIAYELDGPLREAMAAEGTPARFIPSPPGLKRRLPLQLAAALGGAQVVHTHHLGPMIYGGAAALLRRAPHLHTEHSVEGYDALRRRAVARALALRARVVSVSPAVAAWRREHLGDVAAWVVENGVVVPPPVTAAHRARARLAVGVPREAFVVGSVARLEPEKDPVGLVRAFALLARAQPRARLVVVGDGGLRGQLEAEVRVLGLDDQVRLLGQRLDAETLYPAFDVISLASRREGLPLALLEGMAAGVPAVATGVGGVPALLDGGRGQAVPPQDPSALADAWTRWLVDPSARRRAGDLSRAHVEAHHGMSAVAGRYAALYRALARRGWRSRR